MVLSMPDAGWYLVRAKTGGGLTAHLLGLGATPPDDPVDPPDPPAARWDETQLAVAGATYTRPRQSDDPDVYVDWEGIVGSTEAARQAAAPNTPTVLPRAVWNQVTVNAAGKRRILSLPRGSFLFESASFRQADSGYGSIPQNIKVSGADLAGTFRIQSVDGTLQANLAFNASAAAVQAAIRAWGGGYATTTVTGTTVTTAATHPVTTNTYAAVVSPTNKSLVLLPTGLTYQSGTTLTCKISNSNACAFAIGQGASVGFHAGCRGIVGAGSQFMANTTTLTMSGAETVAGLYQFITVNGAENPMFKGLHFLAQQTRGDGVFFGGISLNQCTGRQGEIGFVSMRGMNAGYSNFPPGETFGINIFGSPDIWIHDVEVDGRDKNGVRTCASPLGWNSCGYSNGFYQASTANTLNFVLVERVYVHHGLASMLTFWETHHIKTVDYKTYAWASGSGVLRGSGINHEQIGGQVTHIRPTLFVGYTTSNKVAAGDRTTNDGSHMGFGTTAATPTITITDVQWDTNYNAGNTNGGNLHLKWSYGYKVTTAGLEGRLGWDYMTILPKVIPAAQWITPDAVPTELQWSLQRTFKGQASVSGWQSKDKRYWISGETG